MKFFKKIRIIITVFIVTILITNTNSLKAKELKQIDVSYSTYLYYVNNDYLGEDISYDEWKNLVESSYKMEDYLLNSDQFYQVYSSGSSWDYGSVSIIKGDIILTNGSETLGVVGHSGIAISSEDILHIANIGTVPSVINIYKWLEAYTTRYGQWTRIYRHKNYNVASSAAECAKKLYMGSKAKYKITSDIYGTNETYCSKLVWQSYYYSSNGAETTTPATGYIRPYDLPLFIHNVSFKDEWTN